MSQGAFRTSGTAGGNSGDPKGKRVFNVQVTLSALITTGIIAIIGLGWVFAFGVIVGRGYNPEKKMPELAKLLPAPASTTEEVPRQDILKAEDLTFMSDLKERPRTLGNATTSKPAADAAKTKPESKPAASAASGAPGASGTSGDAAKNAAKAQEASPASKAVFDYVMQIVAYKNSGQADTLRERLEGEGLRTRMTIEKDSAGKARWYRVQVLFRGVETEADAVKARLGRLGLKDASVVTKKPVGKTR